MTSLVKKMFGQIQFLGPRLLQKMAIMQKYKLLKKYALCIFSKVTPKM